MKVHYGMKIKHLQIIQNTKNTARLGIRTDGDNPLICISLNPTFEETIIPNSLLWNIERVALENGYDSWINMCLYPQIANSIDELHIRQKKGYIQENIDFIFDTIEKQNSKDVWAAWGSGVETRSYLIKSIFFLNYHSNFSQEVKWFSVGDLLPKWHPRTPLQLKESIKLEPFDLSEYFRFL